LYPREFRILPVGGESGAAQWIAHALRIAEPPAQPPPASAETSTSNREPPPSTATGQGNAFLIEICNQVHRLTRSAKKIQEGGGAEGDRLNRHVERLRQVLNDHSVSWEDLTGQAFDSGRSDFEPLGEPQVVAGLRRKTIVQCERPVIRLSGKLVQSARGVVGKPPD
jgi:hypothetical protein